jgi:predicted DNA-binding WGR domain protein
MAFLTRIDPTRNIDRFYVVDILSSLLFGGWTVLRENGRRGSRGTLRLTSYARRDDAEAASGKSSSAGRSTATRRSDEMLRQPPWPTVYAGRQQGFV